MKQLNLCRRSQEQKKKKKDLFSTTVRCYVSESTLTHFDEKF